MASQTSPFDSTRWYRFFNTDTGSNLTISSGQDQDTNGAINMTTAETFSSSENWQLFFQSGIFFIRNYDYNTEQLGISSSSSSNPALTNPSGDLSQQWNLTQWSDGTWKVQNLMLGNAQILGLSPDNTVPSMEPSDVGGHWNISENPSAGQITLSALLNPLANIAVCSSLFSWGWYQEFERRGQCLHIRHVRKKPPTVLSSRRLIANPHRMSHPPPRPPRPP